MATRWGPRLALTMSTMQADLVSRKSRWIRRGPAAGSTYNGTLVLPPDALSPNGPLTDMATGRFAWPVSGSGELVMPILQGADNATATLRIYGVSEIVASPAGDVPQLVFVPLWQGVVTACTRTGIAGGVVDTNWRYCDEFGSLADRAINPPGTRYLRAGTADNEPAAILVDALGFQYLSASMTRGTATAMSLLTMPVSGG